MEEVYYCVVGIEMGMTCASKIELLGTFTKVEDAKHFIKHKVRGNQYSITDILETFIDKQNLNLQNSIHLN